MTDYYAVVENGIVTNVVVWDGETEWDDSSKSVPLTGEAGIGWSYADGVFTAPVVKKTPEELAAENMAKAQSEYERATVEINALNEQIEDSDWTGTTEDAVKASLATWTDYRKSLRAYLKAADGSIDLPKSPE